MSIRRFPGSHSRRPSPQSAASGPRRLTEEESFEEADDSEEENEEEEDRYSELQPTEQGIPKAVKKTLFLDIQARGGLETFSLKKLCDDKPDIYGTSKSVFRRKIKTKSIAGRQQSKRSTTTFAFSVLLVPPFQQQQQQPPSQPSRQEPPSQPSRQEPLPPRSPPSLPRPPFRQLRFSPSIINSPGAANNPIPFLQALLATRLLEPKFEP